MDSPYGKYGVNLRNLGMNIHMHRFLMYLFDHFFIFDSMQSKSGIINFRNWEGEESTRELTQVFASGINN